VLTLGSDGNLYVAAGGHVAVVSPASHRVIREITVSGGLASSVAVSPDGSRLYVSTFTTASETLGLRTYDLASGTQLSASSASIGGGGNLVATSGGVWGTAGVGMTERVWFAPDADLTRIVIVSQGAGAGLASVPTLSDGTVWIGGSHTLECANPATGRVLDQTAIPTDGGVVEYFGSVTFTGSHAYAYYQNVRGQQSGVAALTPPSACSG
jgi:DNA-binding beta-propeller fold protein YncE